MLDFDISEAPRNHDGLMVATHTFAGRDLEGPEVTAQIGPAKLVVKRRGAKRTIRHNLKRRHNAIGLSVIQLPRAGMLR